jgi:serine O-acetyltransferase
MHQIRTRLTNSDAAEVSMLPRPALRVRIYEKNRKDRTSGMKGKQDVSATDPDWHREAPKAFWDPPRLLLNALRRYDYWQAQSGPWAKIARRRWVLSHRVWSVVTQAEIHLGTSIGGGLHMPHPNGVVIHPKATIGPNCTLMSQVTIGTDRDGAVPRIGGHVDIGAGARILGGVTIGDHAQIGANAVVTRDVPEGMIAVGIPARNRRPGNS